MPTKARAIATTAASAPPGDGGTATPDPAVSGEALGASAAGTTP
ncbi:MAG TPA: hypothetical protein VGM69_15060 [Chloroflexota bacterium]